jgi:hypothetical protein
MWLKENGNGVEIDIKKQCRYVYLSALAYNAVCAGRPPFALHANLIKLVE